MPDKLRVFNRLGFPADQELFGRHVVHANLSALRRALARHVIRQDGRHGLNLGDLSLHLLRGLHCLRITRLRGLCGLLRQLLDSLLALLCVFFVGIALGGRDFDLVVVHQLSQLGFVKTFVVFALLGVPVVPPHLDDAVLAQKGIFHPAVGDAFAVVLLVVDVVDEVGGLLCLLLITRLVRFKLDDALAARELHHQLRQHGFDGVANVWRNDSRAAFHFRRGQIAHGFAEVIPHGLETLGRQLAAENAHGRAHLLIRDRSQLVFAHSCHLLRSASQRLRPCLFMRN